jgi:hypothetical protein
MGFLQEYGIVHLQLLLFAVVALLANALGGSVIANGTAVCSA